MNGCDLQKRNFLKNIAVAGAAGGIVAMSQLSAAAEGSDCPSKNSVFNVRDFGAKGDGKTSDTAAIQSALDAAGKIQGTVYFPAGKYVCAKLKLPPNTTMLAEPQGLYIRGLGKKAKISHGIYLNNDKYSPKEDSCVIEDCRVENFSGDGVYLKRVWLFIVRRNIFMGNGGAGIRVQGWDGFVSDNQLSANSSGGFVGDTTVATVMFTANRVEWNGSFGLDIPQGDAWNITGNCFDRNWGAGLRLCNVADSTVTGNVFRRCGKDASKLGDIYSCQVYLESCKGIAVTANSGAAGKDDRGKGVITPKYGFVTKNLTYCAVTSNTMYMGFTDKFFNELSPNTECVVKDNLGTIRK